MCKILPKKKYRTFIFTDIKAIRYCYRIVFTFTIEETSKILGEQSRAPERYHKRPNLIFPNQKIATKKLSVTVCHKGKRVFKSKSGLMTHRKAFLKLERGMPE